MIRASKTEMWERFKATNPALPDISDFIDCGDSFEDIEGAWMDECQRLLRVWAKTQGYREHKSGVWQKEDI